MNVTNRSLYDRSAKERRESEKKIIKQKEFLTRNQANSPGSAAKIVKISTEAFYLRLLHTGIFKEGK